MSVLSDLFQDIADAIRTKTGDEGKIVPANFPNEILSIVAGGTSGEGTGGGALEDGTLGDLKFASGSFVSPETGFGRVTVRHELGVLPDFIMVFHAKGMLEEDVEYIADTCPLLFTYNVRSGLSSVYAGGALSFLNRNVSLIGGFEKTIDSVFDGLDFGASIYCNSDTTFSVGNDVNRDGKFGFIPNTTYWWVAISGMGGAVSGESIHLRYVTFLNYDGTELGKKPVAVGDNCANPISRGLFATPKQESDVQYNYTFSGWSTTQGGAASSAALNTVNEDRTLWAAYTSTLRSYTVTFYDADGTTVLSTQTVQYGSLPSNFAPSKDGMSFNGWQPEFSEVTGDTSYTAKWAEQITFAGASWADISRIAESGEAASTFALGDTRDINFKYDNKDYAVTMEIVAFNHDDKADGSGKAGITLCMKNTIKQYEGINADGANQADVQWPVWILRTRLNGETFNSLPADLQSVIKPVTKRTIGFDGTKEVTYTTEDKLWAVSLGEAFASLSSHPRENVEKYPGFNPNTKDHQYILRTSNRASNSTKAIYSYRPAVPIIAQGSYASTWEYRLLMGFCI